MLPSGQSARFEHDARGRLIRVFQPTRDGAQEMIAARYEVDATGQLVEAVDGSGRSSKYGYHAHLLTKEIAPSGLVRRFVYDGEGTLARVTYERWEDHERELFFDAERGVVGVGDAKGGSFSLNVAADHQITKALDHFANEVTRTYDEHTGLLASQTTPNGETSYLYDADYHLADVSGPDRGAVALEHDGGAHLTKQVDADGHAAQWAWDHLGD